MDEDLVNQLDTFIDEAAEESFPEVIRDVSPGQRDSFSALAVDRLFERRMGEYSTAAAAIAERSEMREGIEALASLFPTPLWSSYWNIIFGTRTNASVRA